MRAADIEIGGEYALGQYGTVRKVRVTEKGLLGSSYSDRRDRVRYELVAGPPLRGLDAEGHPRQRGTARTRDLHPWTEADDTRLRTQAEAEAREARIERVVDRLAIVGGPSHGRVWIKDDSFFELAERLGVETD